MREHLPELHDMPTNLGKIRAVTLVQVNGTADAYDVELTGGSRKGATPPICLPEGATRQALSSFGSVGGRVYEELPAAGVAHVNGPCDTWSPAQLRTDNRDPVTLLDRMACPTQAHQPVDAG